MCASSEETGAVPLCFHKITRFYFPWLQYYLSSSQASHLSILLVQVKKALPAIPSLNFRGSELHILTAALGNIFLSCT